MSKRARYGVIVAGVLIFFSWLMIYSAPQLFDNHVAERLGLLR
jgi:hypothetical protein